MNELYFIQYDIVIILYIVLLCTFQKFLILKNKIFLSYIKYYTVIKQNIWKIDIYDFFLF